MVLGQTITVVNKSGKIVSSSKQLVNVFKEAKAAYRERKAEIEYAREAELEQKRAQRRAQRLIEDDHGSHYSSKSKHTSRSKSHKHKERPPVERGYTDSFYANDNQYIQEELPVRSRELIRRHTDGAPESSNRRYSEPHNNTSPRSSIDMDLAYGDLPPPLPVRKFEEDEELRGQMSKLTVMLNEANCLQYSVTTMVEHLQKNPDALAAVALTLAEISNLATKLAPGALAALKGSFPAAIALLASPQFLIAAGVGVGVTVVMLGGYKIIKSIKDRAENAPQLEAPIEVQELQELQELEDVDLSRIELWRRGIAEAGELSSGSTVDGEFITPGANQRLTEEGVLHRRATDARSTKSGKTRTSKSGHRRHSETVVDDASSKAGSSASRRKVKDGKKKKAPSGLKLLFTGTSRHS